ncbi:hypothetical protein [Krasilnikovia sp. MM14-A1259]|uniref:hypothetical protein n=1 Tax=Krasilnikovia sp. MM14-A1259 TaxID=3373539 RepID=UPI0037F60221
MPSRPWRLGCLSLVIAVGLSGCAQARPDSRPAGPPATLDTSAVDLVTHSGSWPGTEQILIDALDRFTTTCLAGQGFPRPRFPAAPRPVAPENESAVIDLPQRRASGYGIATHPRRDDPSISAEPPDSYVDSLPAPEQRRYASALLGPPDRTRTVTLPDGAQVTVREQGCVPAGRRQLAGDVATFARMSYFPEELGNRLADQATTTPDYLAALAGWRSCMAARSLRYDSPEQAQKALRSEPHRDTEQFRKREITVAVADGDCAAGAHLVAVSLAARRRLAAAMPTGDRAALAELARERDAAVMRARTILHD